MIVNLPKIAQLIYEKKGNEIWRYISGEIVLSNAELISVNPFLIKSGEINYLFTSDKNYIGQENPYIILTSKKPTKRDFEAGNINCKRWLKHPRFEAKSPAEIVDSWVGKFTFAAEDEKTGRKGLRKPQMGALYSIMAHLQNPDERAVVVMPTGTGKTETMLATLMANCCEKLLVSVPSDSLRTQIANKFITLGLLKEYSIVDTSCLFPFVGVVNSGFDSIDDLNEFIENCNVVVSTMVLLTDMPLPNKAVLNKSFSHFFVDEAHHSEASTWKDLITKFSKEKVFLFTATPFRNDGKSLQGKVIFNFSLRKAQEQEYYKKINYLPIREYNQKLADKKIADKAVEQLNMDIAQGFKHIIMARCANKVRAKEVFEHYKVYQEHSPIIVYTGIAGLEKKIEQIKRGEHSIIVCVNMLGEGFDLPSLKIAAVHDERQSLPITLQFIGRFTRTSYDQLGEASFITNIAYPPIHDELDQLYAKNADWNLILPRMSANATQREINIKEFLEGFANLTDSIIPFGEIYPALSTIIYRNTSNTWSPNRVQWESEFPGIENYEHVFTDTNHKDTLVIVLGRIERVEWGRFETVQNLHWDIVVLHWHLEVGVNRVFLNTSIKGFLGQSLIDAIFGKDKTSLITGMNVFRIFHEVNRLSLYNVGARRGLGQDVTFQSYFGKGVQDGIKGIEQGSLIKNNIFGVGYKEGEKISLGCSVKGKIWSYQRGNLDELTKWCRQIGGIVENESIDPNVVLQHTLAIEKIDKRPEVAPILVDWFPEMYEFAENRYQISIDGIVNDLSGVELNVVNVPLDENLQFSIDTPEASVIYEIEIGVNPSSGEKYFGIIQVTNSKCLIHYAGKKENLVDFFSKFSPTIWFADGSQLFQNLYVRLKTMPETIPNENIITEDWIGVDIAKESQDIHPYVQDSIQYYFIRKIEEDYQIVFDDDGPGEIADIVAINDTADMIDIHLYHLKYAKRGKVNNEIDNFYQVCGQAQKSLKWKHRDGREFFNHLFRRKVKTLSGNTCSRLIKGSEDDLENLLNQAKYTKPMSFHVYIVQPSLSKSNASEDILLLLGNVYHYLETVGNIELKVYSSQ